MDLSFILSVFLFVLIYDSLFGGNLYMKFASKVSKFIIQAILITVLSPFTAAMASAQSTQVTSLPIEALDLNRGNERLRERAAEQLLSDDAVLHHLESTLMAGGNHNARLGIAQSNEESLALMKKNRDKSGQDHYLYQRM